MQPFNTIKANHPSTCARSSWTEGNEDLKQFEREVTKRGKPRTVNLLPNPGDHLVPTKEHSPL